LILIVQNATDSRDNGSRDIHPWRAGQQANEEYEQSCTDGPHGPGEVVFNPVLYSRDLTGDHQPRADQYQQNAEKEIGSILSHGILLFETKD